VGLAAVGTGITLAAASDPAGELTSLSLISFGAGFTIGGLVVLAIAHDTTEGEVIETLDREGRPAAIRKWREIAERHEANRHGAAIFFGALGALALGAGVAVPLASEDARSERGRTLWGAMTVFGMTTLTMAPLIWFSESPTEVAYKAYTTATGMTVSRSTPLRTARASIAPTSGGGLVSFGFSF
jgi:hypothetical protein